MQPTPSPPIHDHFTFGRGMACCAAALAVVGALYLGHPGIAISLVVLFYLAVLY